MVNVYVDESGNAGAFDPKQPVFALSAIVISDADAEKEKLVLPTKLLQGNELKHENLSKDHRKKMRDSLVALQRNLIVGYPTLVYAVEHRFCLIQKLLMDCIPGNDPRVYWIQQIALDIYNDYDELVRICGFDQILMKYDEVISMNAEAADFHDALTEFQKRLLDATSKAEVLSFALGDFARGNDACVDEFMSSCGDVNLHLILLFGILNEMLKMVSDDVCVIFDESPQFRQVKDAWKRPLMRQVKDVVSMPSHQSLGIQLADILAGGARLVGERMFKSSVGRTKEKAYCDELEKVYAQKDIMLFQPPYFPIPTFARVPELLSQRVR